MVYNCNKKSDYGNNTIRELEVFIYSINENLEKTIVLSV